MFSNIYSVNPRFGPHRLVKLDTPPFCLFVCIHIPFHHNHNPVYQTLQHLCYNMAAIGNASIHTGTAGIQDFESPRHNHNPVSLRRHQMMPYPHLGLGCPQVPCRGLRRNDQHPSHIDTKWTPYLLHDSDNGTRKYSIPIEVPQGTYAALPAVQGMLCEE